MAARSMAGAPDTEAAAMKAAAIKAADTNQDKSKFWKGVSAGFLAGMAIAAALRYTPFEKFITNLSTVDGKLDNALAQLEVKLNPKSQHVENLAASIANHNVIREPALPIDISIEATPVVEPPRMREATLPAFSEAEPLDESEPSTLAAARTGAVASFLRSGAIAGGRTTPARYPVPGIDLPRPDHIDLTRPVGAGPRNFDIGSAG